MPAEIAIAVSHPKLGIRNREGPLMECRNCYLVELLLQLFDVTFDQTSVVSQYLRE